MKFRSVFAGIDRYSSGLISNLTCSVRDARALHALFGDSLGATDSILLTNEEATRPAIIKALEGLQATDPDDVVVIGFSGHGSDSHHLIPHDTDPLDLDATAIRLDELTDLFSRIPADNLLLLLDCCFAGGAGAKVFHPPVAAKGSVSAEALLQRISGKGRLIFTASTAKQEALEDRRRGHSLFSFYVLEGLRGAPEVVKGDRLPVLSMFEFVTRMVVAAAKDIRHEQEPTLRGTVEGDLSFPVLKPGALFYSFFPERGAALTSGDVAGLRAYGFPQPLIDILNAAIPGLNQLQQDAVNNGGLFDGQHLVVSAPTSSGKTMIGELAALYGHTRGERTYVLLPLRALVNDKHAEFQAKYGAFGISVIRSTGEISDDNDLLFRGKFAIALLTYERFAAIALTAPHVLRQVGVVIVDEVQMITDRNRGANLEFILTLLKAQRRLGVEPQVIALSAVIGETNGFEAWLNARYLSTDKRPVPLEEGLLTMDGALRILTPEGKEVHVPGYVTPEYRRGSSQDVIIPLVRQLAAAGEKVIVFRETKAIARATAAYLSDNLGLPAATDTLELLPMGDPTAASAQLERCVGGGVAFHTADLDREERFAIESTFRDPMSALKVLVATTTVAMGVNTPAWSVVIAGLEHPDGSYSVAEYKNMVGRAGRLGFTPKGKSFLVATSPAEAYRLWSTYVLGKPEALVSRFADQDPLSLVCRVLATASGARVIGLTAEELVDFVDSTFAAHQRGGLLGAEVIKQSVGKLVAAGLAESVDGRIRLTEIGKVSGELGIEVESVVRIARGLRELPGSAMSPTVMLAVAQTAVELDAVLIPVHRKSIKERQRWQGTVSQQGLPGSVLREMRATDDAGYTARCKRLAAVLMWVEGVELGSLEASLLQHLPSDNAAGSIRAVAERTRDLLGVVARIGALVATDGTSPTADVDSIGVRLELGLPGDAVWLASIIGRGLERGDYLALRNAGFIGEEQLTQATDAEMKKVLRSDRAVEAVRKALEISRKAALAPTGGQLPMPKPGGMS